MPSRYILAAFTVRCAIYTRKSSDEGLEQEFNSLDAQREACEAYIVSQRHAGWVALADMYDDGGLSGGSMERPALKRLLEDWCTLGHDRTGLNLRTNGLKSDFPVDCPAASQDRRARPRC
jgi:hypothetical protein